MLSRNMEKLVLHLARDGRLTLDLNDAITRGVLVTHEGRVVVPLLPSLVTPSARPA
jgi:hypothetical protein